ncbi:BatA domain-containing protein [Lignipirellula cremea]|uniref:Aerotolerance regulator N-terminal domain-containing protein n=1 Tax=Lignipirellula cremea TaxID=2528010 RepID=A0A518DMS5_9BACT|nr:BatA domain-containing protein [Lignipirellula cremea]QDU93147.1 hypothetical protein Pla8534_09260 [Lignipirellula cremea]
MSFIFPAIAISGALMMLGPLLIHLINMMRHRRVKWAAMDFLLQSYKKHRNYVWLKQLLLLLARMAAMLLLGLLLAGMGCHSQISRWLEGNVTHHYVLIDDSYSMNDNSGSGQTAFDRALRAVEQIGNRAATLEGRHEITVLRYSRAGGGKSNSPDGDEEDVDKDKKAAPAEALPGTADTNKNLVAQAFRMADVAGEIVDEEFQVFWEDRSQGMTPTELSVGPLGVLQVVRAVIGESGDQQNVVYLVSDFRRQDWDNASEARSVLGEMHESGAQVELISCVEAERPNLAITALKPEERTQAAGVPLFMTIEVKNYGKELARNVQLTVRTSFYNRSDEVDGDPQAIAADPDDLPVVLIPEIKAGEKVTRRVQVYFPAAGRHVVEAFLPPDACPTDDRRFCVIDFPDGVPVLLIDGDVNQENAYFANSIFNPSFLQDDLKDQDARARSGVKPQVETAAFLRDATLESLERFRVIYLLDVPRLDASAVTVLEEYVKRGGGLGVFAGPNMNLSWYTTNFYRDGEGAFPLPLSRDAGLLADPTVDVPDIDVTSHPIFESFNTERNALARISSIERYLQPPAEWVSGEDSSVRVLASLRNGDPLAVERRFGDGRVTAFLTTMSPLWNNMARRYTLPIILFNMQSYLESSAQGKEDRVVGSPLNLQVESARFTKDVDFVAPSVDGSRMVIEKMGIRPEENSPLMNSSLGGRENDGQRSGETDRSGVYEAWLFALDGPPEVRRYALNVDTDEGDLAISDSKQLLEYLDAAKPSMVQWDEFIEDPEKQAGANVSLAVLGILIALLLGEQALAYSASYHPTRGGVR